MLRRLSGMLSRRPTEQSVETEDRPPARLVAEAELRRPEQANGPAEHTQAVSIEQTPTSQVVEEAAAPPVVQDESDFAIYHQYPPHVLYTFRDKQVVVNDALRRYSAVPVEEEASGLSSDPMRILNFFQLIEQANRLPAGDYLELGSHKGFSTRVIHKFMDPSRTLYAFDTFDGFDERDVVVEREKYESQWQAGTFAPTSVERVALYVGDGAWPANLKVVKGWFPESFAGYEHLHWRFVHVDFDLYQPIKSAMETVWDKLVPGGILLVHDYGCYGFPAARLAVDEFCESVGLAPIELSDRWSSAVIRKPLRPTPP